MAQGQALAPVEETGAELPELTDPAMQSTVRNIEQSEKLVATVLEPDVDYGIHSGTNLMALRDCGSSKIINAFRCYTEHTILHAREDDEVISYLIQVKLISRPLGKIVATGVGGMLHAGIQIWVSLCPAA